jgi:hypothetical protein
VSLRPPVLWTVSQVLCARFQTRRRLPQNANISGMNGRSSSLPFSSSVAIIASGLRTLTQAPARKRKESLCWPLMTIGSTRGATSAMSELEKQNCIIRFCGSSVYSWRECTELTPRPGESVLESDFQLSITVPTRGRPEHIVECISSILACQGPPFEVFVVDQSQDHATAQALAAFQRDPRLRYIRSEPRGVCAARNIGIAKSRGAILVCTDDDCRADLDWIANLFTTFTRNPDVAVVCGRVFVSEELCRTGYAVSYAADRGEFTIDSMRRGIFPLTANLAFRRETVDAIGMFDEALGSGGALRSGGEPDFLLRVLRSRRRIIDAPHASVTHLGVRVGSAADALMQKYLFGTGAALAKHVRLGDPWGVDLFAHYLGDSTRHAVRNLLRTGRPRGLENAVALIRGAVSSLRFSVDSHSRLYTPRD